MIIQQYAQNPSHNQSSNTETEVYGSVFEDYVDVMNFPDMDPHEDQMNHQV